MFETAIEALNYIGHLFSDIGLFLGFTGQMLGQILTKLGLPFKYVWNFITGFWTSASVSKAPSDLYLFDPEILEIFDKIPLWETLTLVLGFGLLIITGFAIFKVFQKI